MNKIICVFDGDDAPEEMEFADGEAPHEVAAALWPDRVIIRFEVPPPAPVEAAAVLTYPVPDDIHALVAVNVQLADVVNSIDNLAVDIAEIKQRIERWLTTFQPPA